MPIEVVSGADAVANVANEPVFLMLYGPPGYGKTTDAVSAFVRGDRCAAFFIHCEEGALKPIVARGLPMPDHPRHVTKTWEQLTEAIMFAHQHRDRYQAVIIDTLSTWTGTVYQEIEDNFKGKNRYDIPGQMHKMLRQLREGCRALGLHVVMISHMQPPVFNEAGVLQMKGGPLATPKTAMGRYVGAVDTILRVDVCRIGMQNQRVYYTGGPNWTHPGLPPADVENWWQKNREGVGDMVVPPDLAAFLRMRKPPYPGF